MSNTCGIMHLILLNSKSIPSFPIMICCLCNALAITAIEENPK